MKGGDPWLIWFDGAELTLYTGDLVTYKGHETDRWPQTCQCRQQIQVFLHCVAKGGPHADQKLDKRSRLGITHKR